MSTGITIGAGPRSAAGFEQITVSSTAIGISAELIEQFTAGDPPQRNQAIGAYISTETDSIRCTFDGTTPTASIGHLYTAGSAFEIWGLINIKRFRMIRVTNDATATVTTWSE